MEKKEKEFEDFRAKADKELRQFIINQAESFQKNNNDVFTAMTALTSAFTKALIVSIKGMEEMAKAASVPYDAELTGHVAIKIIHDSFCTQCKDGATAHTATMH
jgi:hypothetical protein